MNKGATYEYKNGVYVIPDLEKAIMENVCQYPTYEDIRQEHYEYVKSILNSPQKTSRITKKK